MCHWTFFWSCDHIPLFYLASGGYYITLVVNEPRYLPHLLCKALPQLEMTFLTFYTWSNDPPDLILPGEHCRVGMGYSAKILHLTQMHKICVCVKWGFFKLNPCTHVKHASWSSSMACLHHLNKLTSLCNPKSAGWLWIWCFCYFGYLVLIHLGPYSTCELSIPC